MVSVKRGPYVTRQVAITITLPWKWLQLHNNFLRAGKLMKWRKHLKYQQYINSLDFLQTDRKWNQDLICSKLHFFHFCSQKIFLETVWKQLMCKPVLLVYFLLVHIRSSCPQWRCYHGDLLQPRLLLVVDWFVAASRCSSERSSTEHLAGR